MKKAVGIVLLFAVLISSCAPRPHYMTREGKKKLRYYNSIQYGGKKQVN